MTIGVECRPPGDEAEPRLLILGTRRLEVREVVDRWAGPFYRYFKLVAADGAAYIVRRDDATGT